MTITIGTPYTWHTATYGDVAVHVTNFSPNGKVAVLSIDGGSDSTPANRFGELSDGIYYAVIEGDTLRPRKANPGSRRQSTLKPRIVAGKSQRQLVEDDGSHVAKPVRTRKTHHASVVPISTTDLKNGEVTF